MLIEYKEAKAAIRGINEQRIAFNVCCMGERAGRHGQMKLLRNALDDLVAHFGYK
ncbi:MAG: hypothetical protein K8U57_37160 [Planctomycetes bacterium]|nr:hypothetical protein [Planctomycetota bacterium]